MFEIVLRNDVATEEVGIHFQEAGRIVENWHVVVS